MKNKNLTIISKNPESPPKIDHPFPHEALPSKNFFKPPPSPLHKIAILKEPNTWTWGVAKLTFRISTILGLHQPILDILLQPISYIHADIVILHDINKETN